MFTRLIVFVMHLAGALWLTRVLGVFNGLAVFVGAMILLVAAAGGLLSNCPVNQVTWRNRIAGALLPWSFLIGGGWLTALLVKNFAASVMFGIIIAGVDQMNLWGARTRVDSEGGLTSDWPTTWAVWLTALGWFVLSLGWLVLLNSYLQNRSEPISTLILRKSKLIPLAIPLVAIATSVALQVSANYGWALIAVWVPLIYVFSPVALMTLTIAIHTLLGKPIRWN